MNQRIIFVERIIILIPSRNSNFKGLKLKFYCVKDLSTSSVINFLEYFGKYELHNQSTLSMALLNTNLSKNAFYIQTHNVKVTNIYAYIRFTKNWCDHNC